MPITAVLFDFAGTLFMPAPAAELVRGAAQELGLRLGETEIEQLAADYERAGIPGGPYPERVPDDLLLAYRERDLSQVNHRRAYIGLLDRVSGPHPGLAAAVYDQVLQPERWRAYRETVEVLTALDQAGIAIALISNIGFDPRPIVRSHGVAMLAERAILSYELGITKPAGEMFAAALAALGTAPEETLMVGDNPAADGAAVALGMRALLLPMTAPGTHHGLDLVCRLVLTARG